MCCPCSAAGLRINGMGGETEIDVQRYSYSGNAKRSLRQTAEWAKKAGVTVREVTGNISSGGCKAGSSHGLINSEGLYAMLCCSFLSMFGLLQSLVL